MASVSNNFFGTGTDDLLDRDSFNLIVGSTDIKTN